MLDKFAPGIWEELIMRFFILRDGTCKNCGLPFDTDLRYPLSFICSDCRKGRMKRKLKARLKVFAILFVLAMVLPTSTLHIYFNQA